MNRSRRWKYCLVLALISANASHAQEADPTPVGIVAQPCPATIQPPQALRDRLAELIVEPRTITPADMEPLLKDPQFHAFEEANRKLAARDWAGLCRFSAANAAAQHAPPPRVVFLGDSITENWLLADPALFDHGYVNRGISGQTSAQMLVRFYADVVQLHPKIVHILAGTNDVAGNTGPTRPEDFENNIRAMVDIARAHHIKVIIGSIPPTASFSWQPQLKPVPTIRALNNWLRDYASREQIAYIDYFSPLSGPMGEMRSDLGNDGVHPNRVGYALMRSQVEKTIATLSR